MQLYLIYWTFTDIMTVNTSITRHAGRAGRRSSGDQEVTAKVGKVGQI
jgi:hypothetical protein